MSRLLPLVLLAAPLLCCPAVAADGHRPAVSFDRVSTAGGGRTASVTDGWEFSVKSPIVIAALGVWDHKSDGLGSEVPVGIWDRTGKLIVSATVPGGQDAELVDGFRFVSTKPHLLPAANGYVIGAFYTPKTKDFVVGGGTANAFYTDQAIQWTGRRRQLSSELALPPAQKESHMNLPGGFGPNFKIAWADGAMEKRRYYRVRAVEEKKRTWQTVEFAEAPDGSHKRDRVLTIELFAGQDGRLTQVLLDGVTLGNGDEVLTKLRAETERLVNNYTKRDGYRPTIQLTAVPWARYDNLLKVIKTQTRRSIHSAEPATLGDLQLGDPRRPMTHYDPKLHAGRFKDRGAYVEDTWTGLLWQKDGDESGKHNFYDAAKYAEALELGGLSHWRAPTAAELASIFPANESPFADTRYTPHECCEPPHEYASYWTSEVDHRLEDYAYVYQWYADGGANNCYASRNRAYVRCVHDPIRAQPSARGLSSSGVEQTRTPFDVPQSRKAGKSDRGQRYAFETAPLGQGYRWSSVRYLPQTGDAWLLLDGRWAPISEPKLLAARPQTGPFVVKMFNTGPSRFEAVRMSIPTGRTWLLHDSQWRPVSELDAPAQEAVSHADVEVRTLKGHTGRVTSIAFSPDGKHLASASWDGTARIWRTDNSKLERTFTHHQPRQVNCVQYSPDGRQVITAGSNGVIHQWEPATGRMVRGFASGPTNVRSLAWSDGRILSSHDRKVVLWDGESGRVIKSLESPMDFITTVRLSADGRFGLCAGGRSKSGTFLCLWDMNSGKVAFDLDTDIRTFTRAAAISRDGRLVLAPDYDEHDHLALWEVKSGRKLRAFELDGTIGGVAFSDDARIAATGDAAGSVKVWDLRNGKCLHNWERRHRGGVDSVAISRDGKLVAAAGGDSVVRIWRIGVPE